MIPRKEITQASTHSLQMCVWIHIRKLRQLQNRVPMSYFAVNLRS